MTSRGVGGNTTMVAPVIYGHYAHSKVLAFKITPMVLIQELRDYLTAIILPERRFVQVKAAKDHWREVRAYSYPAHRIPHKTNHNRETNILNYFMILFYVYSGVVL